MKTSSSDSHTYKFTQSFPVIILTTVYYYIYFHTFDSKLFRYLISDTKHFKTFEITYLHGNF